MMLRLLGSRVVAAWIASSLGSPAARVDAHLVQYRSASVRSPAELSAELDSLRSRLEVLENTTAVDALLQFYGKRQHSAFNMDEVVRRCTDPEYDTYLFCHKELPLLLAHHVRLLEALPGGLSAMKSILDVRKLNAECFHRLVSQPLPMCEETRSSFIRVLESIEETRQSFDVLRHMAVGVLELKEHLSRHTRARLYLKAKALDHNEIYARIAHEVQRITEPLDECNRYFVFYNFLSRQLLNMQGQDLADPQSLVGIVDRNLSLVKCVRVAIEDAKQVCTGVYGDCPDVNVVTNEEAENMTFRHQGATIHYIVTELMKNAFRSTVDTHMKRNSLGIVTCEGMPPVEVMIHAKPNTAHACVCISDEGGGIPRSKMPYIMSYTYTTAAKPAMALLTEMGKSKGNSVGGHHEHSCSEEDTKSTSLAGYGFGLPMSRVYARCFGGDLQLQSLEGHGTKAFLYVTHSSADRR